MRRLIATRRQMYYRMLDNRAAANLARVELSVLPWWAIWRRAEMIAIISALTSAEKEIAWALGRATKR